MPYYPDFGEELHSWIETDHPTRYRDQGEQTVSPTLQSQLTAVVNIPPQEPEGRLETNTTLSAETEELPVVLETRLEPTAQVDPDPCEGLSIVLEPEATPVMRQDTAPNPLPADQTEPDALDDSAAVDVTSQNSHPDLGSLETLVGSQSTVPSPRKGTRLRKQPE